MARKPPNPTVTVERRPYNAPAVVSTMQLVPEWEEIARVRDASGLTSRGAVPVVRVTISPTLPARLSYTCGFEEGDGSFRIAVHLDHRYARAFVQLLSRVELRGRQALAQSVDSREELIAAFRAALSA